MWMLVQLMQPPNHLMLKMENSPPLIQHLHLPVPSPNRYIQSGQESLLIAIHYREEELY